MPRCFVNSTEGQAPVALDPVPAQIGDIQSFAHHGLHRVPKESLHLTDLDGHWRFLGNIWKKVRSVGIIGPA